MLDKNDMLDRTIDHDEAPAAGGDGPTNGQLMNEPTNGATAVQESGQANGTRAAHALPPNENLEESAAELFRPEVIEQFRTDWQHIQTRFVDDPRDAVHGADELVTEVMRSLASTFAAHKNDLDGQWQRGGEVETEELRVALRRYRSFFNQLLDA